LYRLKVEIYFIQNKPAEESDAQVQVKKLNQNLSLKYID